MNVRFRQVAGVALLAMILVPGLAFAQLNFSVSPTPVGSGARAAGMSDAFVAVADDATAASWNPAGLIQLEDPELSFVYAYNRLSEDFSSRENPMFDRDFSDTFSSSSDATNFASVVYPAYIWGRNVSFSLAYRNGYDFARAYTLNANNPGRLFSAEFDQSGSLSSITPAVAISLTNTLSVGVSVNLWRSNLISDNDWDIDQRQVARVFNNGSLLARQEVTQIEEFKNFTGENYVFGVLWNATDKWNIGLRYDSSFTGEVDYSRQTDALLVSFGGGMPTEFRQSSSAKEEWKVKFPWTEAIGMSYRFTDRFTLAADVSISDWGDSYVKDESGNRLSIIDGLPRNDVAYTHVERNLVARLGAEYVFIPKELSENLDYL